MGILLNVGSRDENHENSGSCLAIKNTYLKTLKHTNETINYGMIQMSGGECDMQYDEETMFYHAYAFEYDVTDIFRMLGDMVFEPRSILAANVARDKNRQYFKLQHHLSHYNPFQNNPQLLLTTAYGYNTLGMPKSGFESNVENLDAKVLQEFQLDNITPEKVTVVANGVRHHNEFVDLVSETLGPLNPVREVDYQRNRSEYIGGEYRTFTETPDTNIILAYQSVPWTDRDMPVFALLQTIFGSATGFSVGGPGKGMYNRAHRNSI
jgi:processing peptidase subunit alpha